MTPQPTVWPALRYDDAPAAVRFLVDVLGFEETLVVPGGPDRAIAHAELRWPEGGAMMLGSTGGPTDDVHDAMKPGTGAVYVVSDRVDEIHDRVRAAGAEVTLGLHDTEYGSHTFSLRDPEGNSWTIGSYRGA
ncbi:VOC family protein [Amycolatopsis rhabdoformis]|uniref:VOC family protein n=1 Tax=Amycolatopsis rhabdoformis TaxID=1448059 RepID=A0ABZ1I7Q5_9PSEU|nr:VOC family protein [Amycolatopsis rhabdoformis]WSE30463.1 VOC family protein [Amycolatopsis rhabdoformis]